MIQSARITMLGLLACTLILLSFPQPVVASTSSYVQQVLHDINLESQYQVHCTIVQHKCAYILATTVEQGRTKIHLRQAYMNTQGKWINTFGVTTPVTNKPWRLFRKRVNLKYALSRGYINDPKGNTEVKFDWCIYGYTTDPTVSSFRIKTKTGFLPLKAIEKLYFMRILTESEKENFVEVQGLNLQGQVIQRDNGVDEFKPRQWSPQQSEM